MFNEMSGTFRKSVLYKEVTLRTLKMSTDSYSARTQHDVRCLESLAEASKWSLPAPKKRINVCPLFYRSHICHVVDAFAREPSNRPALRMFVYE